MINIPNSNPLALIKITSLAWNDAEPIEFFPYDFEFDDNFKPDWGTYDGFGRMDPIMTYKRTSRSVNLSFNVVAENSIMANKNFVKLNKFITFLYPGYKSEIDFNNLDELKQRSEALKNVVTTSRKAISEIKKPEDRPSDTVLAPMLQEIQKIENEITSQETISQMNIQVMQRSPLFKISFMNLLNNGDYIIAITNFKHKMKFDAADTSFSKDGVAIPGEFNINMTFTILHTYTPGNYPYSAI